MHITTVALTVTDLPAAAAFFANVLDLPVTGDELTRDIAVGSSTLRLSEGARSNGVHHLAFDVAPEAFRDHRDWLAARVPLLSSADGRTELEGPPAWNSRSIYFTGPDEMVLELIARRERPRPNTRVPQLISISEVGIAVPDVTAAVATAAATMNAGVLGSASPEFAPVGDHDGLLILVRPGRGWLPVFDVHAGQLPLEVDVTAPAVAARTVPLTDFATIRITPLGP